MTLSNHKYSLPELQAQDAAHFLHPFTDHKELRAQGSRMIVRGEGAFIYDSEGGELLDAMAGLWCVNIGYGRDELAEVAAAQMRELPYYNAFFKCATPAPVQLSAKLAELAPPNINQVFYGSSGSESNDTAVRLVRHYWALEGKPEKNIIISRNNAYHGSTVAGASLGGMSHMHKQMGGMVPNIVHVLEPYAYELALPGESDDDFGLRAAHAIEEAILAAGADKVAAFIGEPIMGAGGVRIPPASYWPEVQRICRKYDILLMLDEVITGYGRTGEWFAATTFGIEADTITTAKALTSGYQPLSALLVGDRIANTLVEKGGEFNHGYTYSGHPVCCAVALKNLEIIDNEGLVERVRTDTGPYLAKELARRLNAHPLVGQTRSIGLMGAVEIVRDKAERTRFKPDGSAAIKVRDHAVRNGLMIRATGDTLIMSPPLVWTRETIDLALNRLLVALDLAEADLAPLR
ncbi:aspartate aminotransferase family protein [Rhizobium sp. LjRoot98]|uniref:aspartate aminotransferase family protein n=1 Tax=unclassified Rhizobium TaxID=2613769 RepID=UPI000713DB8D|nr:MULTISPECIES: aspartate aminotransferase family protein [unclassified Rhizobium]KQV37562.1 aminotransferase [Rhizobium sp. Root1204]KQY02567.1 aminotransferase [Rhizobium sp. Root1334]KRB99427.1 aminotransferase [Rhizobium sp. Root73]